MQSPADNEQAKKRILRSTTGDRDVDGAVGVHAASVGTPWGDGSHRHERQPSGTSPRDESAELSAKAASCLYTSRIQHDDWTHFWRCEVGIPRGIMASAWTSCTSCCPPCRLPRTSHIMEFILAQREAQAQLDA